MTNDFQFRTANGHIGRLSGIWVFTRIADMTFSLSPHEDGRPR
jgi:hypothetical protein